MVSMKYTYRRAEIKAVYWWGAEKDIEDTCHNIHFLYIV